jgi:hypothetical protein
VLALCLALWAAERFGGAPVDGSLVANIGSFSVSEEDVQSAFGWRFDTDDLPFRRP